MNPDKNMLDVHVNKHDGEDRPLVSVVIPSYNHAAYIEQCIDSVISQDYVNMELIVIDDGSKDNSVEVIRAMVTKCQLRFVRFEFRARANKGLPATMNEALDWAQGKYFSYISSDDLMLPGKTSRLVESIKGLPFVSGVFCGAQTIDALSDAVANRSVPTATFCGFNEIFLHTQSLVASSMLLDLDAVKAVGGYDETVFFEDWYMWLKLTDSGSKLMILPDVLVKYRIHADNMSKNIPKMQEGRVRIAGMFNQHKLYPQVMANIYAASALEYSEISGVETVRYLAKSLGLSFRVAFTHNFKYALAKLMLPKAMLHLIKRAL